MCRQIRRILAQSTELNDALHACGPCGGGEIVCGQQMQQTPSELASRSREEDLFRRRHGFNHPFLARIATCSPQVQTSVNRPLEGKKASKSKSLGIVVKAV